MAVISISLSRSKLITDNTTFANKFSSDADENYYFFSLFFFFFVSLYWSWGKLVPFLDE
jgi:hypothetical protein